MCLESPLPQYLSLIASLLIRQRLLVTCSRTRRRRSERRSRPRIRPACLRASRHGYVASGKAQRLRHPR